MMNLSPFSDRMLGERYRIIRPLAQGGMARVFLAEDTRLQRQVAVKLIHPHLASDHSFLERFQREAVLAANLNHPNLVNVFDQGSDSGSPFLVMEYVAGRTLRDVLNEFGSIPEAKVVGLLEQVLLGLSAAHRAGIVHRDIKPENVLLADDGRIKLSDFGLARPVSASASEQLLGTAAYIAPETVTAGQADKRADIYAVGILAFELLTSRQPFSGDDASAVAAQHARESVPSPSELLPGLSRQVDELVLWCTEPNPDDRPDDAQELLEYVRAIAKELVDEPAVPKERTSVETQTSSNATKLLSGQDTNATEVIGAASAVGNLSGATKVIGGGQETLDPNATTVIGGQTGLIGDAPGTDEELPFSRWTQARFWRWLLTTLMVIVLATGAGWWFGAGPGALRALPELTNRTVANAQNALSGLELDVVVTNEYSPDVAQGLVIRTEPGAGSLVFSGTQLKLVVSLGPELRAAPNLSGLNVAEATVEITKTGFTFGGAEAWFNSAPAGTVFDYTGVGGEKIAVGSPINLKVSLGPIPSVAGITQDAATALLGSVGLTVSAVTTEYSDTVPNGQVISLVPASEPLGENGTVELIVSKGSNLVIMPKVVGETIAAAQSALKSLGLVVVIDTDKLSSQWGIVKVKSASVKAGAQLRRGDKVTIVSR